MGSGVSVEDQFRVVLTAHPLQRVGAFALARLAGVGHPDRVGPEGFRRATARMTKDAITAALVRDSKQPDGFWLKSSRSFFPNAKMNHPTIAKASDAELRAGVARWRELQDPDTWPDAPCVLCGRAAVRFFGKMDVPLAESSAYRNTTPRGHEGTALCWPCVCSFYALPYGCRLTGGPSIVLHSWDEDFLRDTVGWRVADNGRIFETGLDTAGQVLAREVVALEALRRYEEPLRAGVDLLVVSNDNRGPSLEVFALEQPLAEWLRRRARGSAYGALLRAHRTERMLGRVGLARNAFRAPERIIRACARYLVGPAAERGALGPETPALAQLTYSFVKEVMAMDPKDLAEIRATAGRVAALLATEQSGGKLNAFYARFRGQRQLRAWLQHEAVYWALKPAEPDAGPLLTTRGYELLFAPGLDGQAWYHRELLLIAVLEELHRRGWRPVDADDVAGKLPQDPRQPDPDEEDPGSEHDHGEGQR
jgi:hypothetical protein